MGTHGPPSRLQEPRFAEGLDAEGSEGFAGISSVDVHPQQEQLDDRVGHLALLQSEAVDGQRFTGKEHQRPHAERLLELFGAVGALQERS